MNVRLHIERLVLDGIDVTPVQRTALVGATEAELGRLFSSNGLPDQVASGFSVPSADGGTIRQATSGFDSVAFGHEVARAIYRGMGGSRETGGSRGTGGTGETGKGGRGE